MAKERDLISRQAVLNALKEHRSLFCDNTPETFSKLSYAEKSRVDELDTAIATIINLPSAENNGEWIAQDIHNCHTNFKCSECGYIHSFMHLYGEPTADYPYCPNCGARMKGGET